MVWMRDRRRALICLLAALAVLWTAFIFRQSSKSGEESSEDSESVVEIIENIVSMVGVDAEVSSRLVRKLAHFAEYLILGVITSVLLGRIRGGWLYAGAFGYSVAVALCDEFIVQRLSEGRGPQFADVLIDSAGAAVGILGTVAVTYLIMRQIKRRKNEE